MVGSIIAAAALRRGTYFDEMRTAIGLALTARLRLRTHTHTHPNMFRALLSTFAAPPVGAGRLVGLTSHGGRRHPNTAEFVPAIMPAAHPNMMRAPRETVIRATWHSPLAIAEGGGATGSTIAAPLHARRRLCGPPPFGIGSVSQLVRDGLGGSLRSAYRASDTIMYVTVIGKLATMPEHVIIVVARRVDVGLRQVLLPRAVLPELSVVVLRFDTWLIRACTTVLAGVASQESIERGFAPRSAFSQCIDDGIRQADGRGEQMLADGVPASVKPAEAILRRPLKHPGTDRAELVQLRR